MIKDLYNQLNCLEGFASQTISTDTTTSGAIIDLQGAMGVLWAIFSATITDGTYTPVIQEGDASNLSDAAAVADADLLGSAETGQEAAAAFTSSDDNTVKTIGYLGVKRYVRLQLVSASTTSGGVLGAVAIREKTLQGGV